ncbi:MAG TPA: hypothetical protein PKM65_12345 [Spirochaetota bacterium]|nr:hypothetical protein [Spirochaetota bacterium]
MTVLIAASLHYEYYSHDQAEEAIGFASKIIAFAQGQVHER